MKLAKHHRLIRVAQGWQRNSKLTDPSNMKINKYTTRDTPQMIENNMTTTREIEATQQEYWKTLENGLPKAGQPIQVEFMDTETPDEQQVEIPVQSKAQSAKQTRFPKNHLIAIRMAKWITSHSGFDLGTDEELVNYFKSNKTFLNALGCAVQANKFLHHATYGYWIYMVSCVRPDLAEAWHERFISGVGLSKNHPILNCKDRIATFYRKSNEAASVKHHQAMLDLLNIHFRRFAAASDRRMNAA